jgi:ATP-dependent helicase/DNAse subunit B
MEVLRLSYSSLKTFSTCARKLEFDKLYPKIKRLNDDSYAADVGTAIHAGYQHYLTGGSEQDSIWEFMQAFPFEAEMSQKNDYRSFEAALATLEEMFTEIKMAEWELARIKRPATQLELTLNPTTLVYEVPAIEVPFEIRFKGVSIPPCRRYPEGASISVIGYIDAILQNYNTKLFRTCDIKTSRIKLDDATGKYKFDSQQVPYGIVVDHVAQGHVDEFEVLYLDCYIDLVEPRVQLYPFLKRKADIEEWATNKILQFQQLARYAAMDYFPRTDSGCLFFNKPCRYLEPCQSRDRDTLEAWFTLGQEPEPELVTADNRRKAFEPWIVADIDVGGEDDSVA